MKTKNPNVQKLIDYLERHLIVNGFKKVGPRCFFFQDDVDTIFVKVTDENLIIITDGENVVDGMEMTRFDIVLPDLSHEQEDEVLNEFLQDILGYF